MCIIAASAIGVALPTTETIETMWFRNSDGAGFMFHKDGKVIIRKGFMKLKDFLTAIDELKKEIDVVNTSVVMHFRIGTHGGNIPENTHPFPVVGKESMLKKLTMTCDIGMAHNGIIHSVQPRAGISDTMEYDIEILSNLRKLTPDFHKHKVCQKLIEETINGSRMCFLTPDGEITYIGNWNDDKETGIRYSNSGYISYKDEYSDWYDSKWKGYGSNWASKFSDYDDDFDIYDTVAGDVIVSPLDSGYIQFDNGEMVESEFDEYYIDESGNVYYYDFETDMLVRLEGAKAFTDIGMPAKMSEDECEMFAWVTEEDFNSYNADK